MVALVKQNDQFIYMAYSAQARRSLMEKMRQPIPVYQAVLDDEPDCYPGFGALLRKKCREYSNQSRAFHDMPEDPEIAAWLRDFTLWDAENEEFIRLNDIQRQDINRILQKRYGMLQWEEGSGKTLAAIATARYRMKKQGAHSAWLHPPLSLSATTGMWFYPITACPMCLWNDWLIWSGSGPAILF